VIEALSRWLAPIISYTADEIWQNIPGKRRDSIFLETWYEDLFPFASDSSLNSACWNHIIAARTAVSKELEALRSHGKIGSSLNAEVTLYCDKELLLNLQSIEPELHFIFITSSAVIFPLKDASEDAMQTDLAGLKLKAVASNHEKCVRCWHHKSDVGSDTSHPELCGRCVENISGEGEVRHYA
ncbi:MAG: class I tRNA ligase family protein, partial [Methylococcales bacterium]|nr:class I tRNA ligase family protein [Methylococcales bacterium]